MIQAIISPRFKQPPNKWLGSLVPTSVVTQMSFIAQTCTCPGKERAGAQAGKGPREPLLASLKWRRELLFFVSSRARVRLKGASTGPGRTAWVTRVCVWWGWIENLGTVVLTVTWNCVNSGKPLGRFLSFSGFCWKERPATCSCMCVESETRYHHKAAGGEPAPGLPSGCPPAAVIGPIRWAVNLCRERDGRWLWPIPWRQKPKDLSYSPGLDKRVCDRWVRGVIGTEQSPWQWPSAKAENSPVCCLAGCRSRRRRGQQGSCAEKFTHVAQHTWHQSVVRWLKLLVLSRAAGGLSRLLSARDPGTGAQRYPWCEYRRTSNCAADAQALVKRVRLEGLPVKVTSSIELASYSYQICKRETTVTDTRGARGSCYSAINLYRTHSFELFPAQTLLGLFIYAQW